MLDETGLKMRGLNTAPGDVAAGDFGLAAGPSRAEPDEGKVDFGRLVPAIRDLGYADLIGAAYKPRSGRISDGLSRMVTLPD